MVRTLRGGWRHLTVPALRVWARIPIRTQGRITIGLPLIAVLISASLAVVGNHQRVALETDIQRKFSTNTALGEVTTLMVNAETGMRGYLLTGQDDFLEPYDQASQELPSAMERITALAAAEPGATPRADKLRRVAQLQILTADQLADLARQLQYVVSGHLAVSDAERHQHLTYGKGLMDEIRTEVDAMQDEERRLLDDRIADINAIRQRDYLSVVIALVAAVGTRFLAWYLFRTGVLRAPDRERTRSPERQAHLVSAAGEERQAGRARAGDLSAGPLSGVSAACR